MKRRVFWQQLLPHFIAVIGFALLAVCYVSPVLQGKRLSMEDDKQAKAAAREVVRYHEKTGEWSQWTNSMFGGMPAYMIAADYPTSLPTKLGQTINKLLPAPANYLFIGLVCAYILFIVLEAGLWLSVFGAIAFTFCSFNVINLEAGHVSQIIAIMYAPGVLAGVLLAFRKHWLAGAAVTALFLSLELYANHPQITYYLGIGVVVLMGIESFSFIKNGRGKDLALILLGLALAAVVSVGSHSTRLWNSYDYTSETSRGKSELKAVGSPQKKGGLDKEYAFQYSYDLGELLTLIIPNAYGGPSYGELDNKSQTYLTLTGHGVQPVAAAGFVKQLPLYWGDQPIMGGPYYVGAMIFFFFVLGIFIVKNPLKSWLTAIVLLYLIWALGKNLSVVNNLFFDFFPMFNKFRAVTMVISLAQLLMVILSVLALRLIVQRKLSWKELKKPFLITLAITGGLTLILTIVPGLFFSFRSVVDSTHLAGFEHMTGDKVFAGQIMDAIVFDRAGMMKADALRTLIIFLLTALLIWLWIKEKIKPWLFYVVLIGLLVLDMFGIDKRYLNNEDFVSGYVAKTAVTPSSADEQILKDPDPDYRVYDVSSSQGPFNSAEASYFHKSLGGYHGAKLRRYQELFERQIYKQNPNFAVLNMLNTKYIITADEKGNKLAQANPEAYGHGWFVKGYKIVPDADAEMAAMDHLNPREEAVLDQRFKVQLAGLVPRRDSTDHIKLVSYKPDEIIYESVSKNDGLAVFSEIYYNVRNEWQVTVDGQPAELLRADYVLRALRIPAGKHRIVFKFEPISVAAGHRIDLVSSVLLFALIAGACIVGVRRNV
ncbi:hypothetical protein [Dyadobacter sp. LHD-138]|uniref:hypothetical protein n=1 Tax=Dyadobacter sp. LHD-138 TaxID=3071413 RepID=UPI0027E078DC|nr:hypothetical protein [Dyadobacter sp. LHD-138]MDQ6482102.1 hypothetical protein [Dyadobacter sp. LHD-138]